MPHYPDVKVKLTGKDGNAFVVMGAVLRAMKRAGIPKEERDTYVKEATAGNYDNLLATTMRYVEVE